MFIEEEIIQDRRPFLAVLAPGREFLLKYFDRAFDRRITSSPDKNECPYAFIILGEKENVTSETEKFCRTCHEKGIKVYILRVPFVIGTGMGSEMMDMARGVARGTLMQIRDNTAKWSVIHATDIALAAKRIAQAEPDQTEFTLSAPPVSVNDLIAAFGHRIKNKKAGMISAAWAKILCGKRLFSKLTADYLVDTSTFDSHFPDFTFSDPAQYLINHVYDNESL